MVGSRPERGGWLENGPRSEDRKRVFPTHLNDLQHLETRDAPVTVQVVHFKGPIEFRSKLPREVTERAQMNSPEVDGAAAVLVEGAESAAQNWRRHRRGRTEAGTRGWGAATASARSRPTPWLPGPLPAHPARPPVSGPAPARLARPLRSVWPAPCLPARPWSAGLRLP